MTRGLSTWLIVICGPVGSGKSRVSRAVAAKLGGTNVLEVEEIADSLRDRLPDMTAAQRRDIARKAALQSIDLMLHEGNHVVLDDPMPSSDDWAQLYDLRETHGWRMLTFNLDAPVEVRGARQAARIEDTTAHARPAFHDDADKLSSVYGALGGDLLPLDATLPVEVIVTTVLERAGHL